MYPKILVAAYKIPAEVMGDKYDLSGLEFSLLTQDYSEALSRVGALPLIFPYLESKKDDEEYIKKVLNEVDGVVLPGGSDIDPALYDSYPQKNLGKISPERDRWELKILRLAMEAKKPILGVCRGFQLINIYYGGSLKVDVCGNNVESKIPHMALMVPKYYKTHKLKIKSGSRLAEIFGKEDIAVNSYHHQAVKEVGQGLIVSGVAPDGVVEAVEDPNYPYLLGVQWHPEMMAAQEEEQLKIFKNFVDFVADYNNQ
ncbi:gamma-glutamyl-gamma-aminobutyrate hydrolase family protein [Halanaerobium sp. Z-7514]|uniref:Gamma-glutamyl-gamma-aminobutyrate hydrolase family protein n=1 Tax=Halanaerobium polyolivorans TaxID=2886943 RepID=A0AAW4X161_9FIRM|nr:gamma-glutamyl-gamma-aminobutyrate hydrolase family protein [Halanaerobium polyolivorans]MCC3145514.1 gamma-glutamyl-gamma-aminobutyrate hydrolase family protein [Halanaerobium polyolivorans]RQD69539.1 MAG: gamma-glutamyl-gamma-aminobutyrate hydrolase family protein [Halanaerobium sp. MSAO_Bac5]